MYYFIHELLSDRKGGETFSCFGGWHFFYIFLAIILGGILFAVFRKKEKSVREKLLTICIDTVFILYILDFFLMPFAYEEIDIEKLPFHVCTATCVACFLSRHVSSLKKYQLNIALLGLVSNFVYLLYPAGVMWHAVHPVSYRVAQTLLFHGLMSIYGFLTAAFDEEGFSWKTCLKNLAVIVLMTLWAMLGNLLYTGSAGKYNNDFNWFFVTRDPFGMMDPKITPFIMPFLNIIVFFLVETAVYALICFFRKQRRSKESADAA